MPSSLSGRPSEEGQTDVRALVAVEKRFHALFDAAPLAIGITRQGIALYANQALANLLCVPEAAQLVGRDLRDYLAPSTRAQFATGAGERVSQSFLAHPRRYELEVCRSDGTLFPVRVEVSPIALPDGEAILSFAVDLSDERRDAAEIKELLEREQRSARFARALQEITGSLSQATSSDEVSAIGVESLVRVSGAYGGIFIVPVRSEDGQTQLRLLQSRGYSAEAVAGWSTMSLDDALPVTISFREAGSVWVENIKEAAQIERFPILAALEANGALVALPMLLDGRVLGVVGLSFDEPRAFDSEERLFLETAASTLGQSLERARLDSEARDMEQSQRESLALLNTLLDSAPVGFALFDRDHRYVLVNEALARMNGLSVEDHLGMRPLELIPAVGERVEAELERVWESGSPSGDIAFVRGDVENGDTFGHYSMSLYPVRVGSKRNGGEMIGVGATLQEQTERVRGDIERNRLLIQLEIERARFETILQQMPSGVVIAEAPSGQIILTNEQVAHIWRQPLDYPKNVGEYGMNYKAFDAEGRALKAHEWPLARAIYRGVFVQGEEISIQRGDGETGIIRVNATPIFDSENRVTAAISVFDDVTVRARADMAQRFLAKVGALLVAERDEREAAQAVARLCVPLMTDECLFVLHQPGKAVNFVIEAEQENTPTNLKTLLEQHGSELIEVKQVLQMQRGLIAPTLHLDDSSHSDELRAVLQTAQTHNCLLAPLFARGRTLGTMIWLSTQSQRTFGRDDLDLAEELARRVAVSLDNVRLLQEAQLARDEAQSANRAKDEFLAVVSHELRTPLTPILGWLELLRSPALDENLREQAYNVIERNAVQQARLVNDILDVSRITTGKLRLELKNVALDDVIAQTIESLQGTLIDKKLALRCEVEANVPVRGDANRLGQVVGNLVQNAIKFTPENGSLLISLRRDTSPTLGSVARLEVSDTGAGIEAELLPFIFDRFRQGDSSSTRKAGGLGLGLAIVKHIVELHGGVVGVNSAGRSQGATFWFEIPLLQGVNGLEALPVTHTRLIEDRLCGAKILIAEDEPDTREMLAKLLEEAGATVRLAQNGRVALEVAAQFAPDAVVSDIGMPEMNGYELRRELLTRGMQMPAVALTAYASSGDQEAARSAGFEQYLAKPVGARELVEVLCELLALPRR